MKKILFILALISTPLLAQVERPEDMVDKPVKVMLHCFPTMERVVELLAKDYQEAPIMMAHMSPTTTMIWFVNRDKSTSTLVVTKAHKDKQESCIMWNGFSEPGMSFSINPEPNFPGKETGWNET